MIDRSDVKATAAHTLGFLLRTNSNAREYLLDPQRFNKWVDLLHIRVNQMLWLFAKSPTPKVTLVDFMQKATIEYGRRQLDKAMMAYDNGARG